MLEFFSNVRMDSTMIIYPGADTGFRKGRGWGGGGGGGGGVRISVNHQNALRSRATFPPLYMEFGGPPKGGGGGLLTPRTPS